MTYNQAKVAIKDGKKVGTNRVIFNYGSDVYMFIDAAGKICLFRKGYNPIPIPFTDDWYLLDESKKK